MQKKPKTVRPRGAHPEPQRVHSARLGSNKENQQPEYNFEKLMKIVEENIPKFETSPQMEEESLSSSMFFSPASSQLNESSIAPQSTFSPVIMSKKTGGAVRYAKEEKKISPSGGKKESKKLTKKGTREEKKEVRQENAEEEMVRKARELDQQMEAIQRQKTELLLRHFEEELDRQFAAQKKEKQAEIEKEYHRSMKQMQSMRSQKLQKIKDIKLQVQTNIQLNMQILKEMESKEAEVQECLGAALTDLKERREMKEMQLLENFEKLKSTRVETFKKYISSRNE